MKKIYFVRHGETDANLHEYVPSKLESLNERGFVQAQTCAERVNTIDFEKIFVSDFLRAQQTAEPIAKNKNIALETVTAFGEVQEPSATFGLSEHDDIVSKNRKERNENIENPLWHKEDGESFNDVFNRIKEAKNILKNDASESILIVSHSFFIQLFASAILLNAMEPSNIWFQMATRFNISNTGVTLFTLDEDKWKLIMWNDHAHFAE